MHERPCLKTGCPVLKANQERHLKRHHSCTGSTFHPFALSQGQGGTWDCLGFEELYSGLPGSTYENSFSRASWPMWRQWLISCRSKTLTCDFLLSPAVRVIAWPNATVQEGQQVNLTCLVWTNEQAPLSYTWYKGGQRLLGARSISLPNVTVIDATSYRCGVGLSGQAPHLSRPVTLDVLCECGWVWVAVERVTKTHRDQGMGKLPSVQPKSSTISQLQSTGQGTLRVGGDGDRSRGPDWTVENSPATCKLALSSLLLNSVCLLDLYRCSPKPAADLPPRDPGQAAGPGTMYCG